MTYFKKALIVLLVPSVLSGKLFSQTYSNNPSSILSFTIGLTSSTLFHDTLNLKSGILYNGGVNYSVMLNDRFNASIEVLYTGKAVKQESPIVKFHYFFVDIPLFLQTKFGENIRLNTGIQYSIASGSTVTTIDPGNANGVNVNKTKNIKPTDYGFLLGAEIDINKSLSLGARYTLSGSTIFEKDQIGFGVFQLSIKYSPIKTYKVFFHKKESK